MASSSSSSSTSTSSGPPSRRKIRVAIVGSGLTGLHAAHALATTSSPTLDIEVHLFERAKKIGLDSSSIDVPQATSLDGDGDAAEGKGKGKMMRIDVPMRSINAGYYPRVAALYRKLGVPLRKSDFTYSFATMAAAPAEGGEKTSLMAKGKASSSSSSSSSSASRVPTPSLLYEGSSGIRGFSLPSSLKRRPTPTRVSADDTNSPLSQAHTILDDLSTRFNESRAYLSSITLFALGYLYLLVVSLWHHYTGHTRDPNHPIARQTLQDYFSPSSSSSLISPTLTLNHTFLHRILVPLFSAMMTVQASSVLRAPVADIMDYVALTFARSHLTAAAGVLEVERRISAPLDPRNVHVECLVQGLRRDQQGKIEIDVVEGSGSDARTYRNFDHVILATQANQSATFVESLVESAAADGGDEKWAEKSGLVEMLDRLRRFTYEDSQVVNHTDRSLLPVRREDWRDLNLVSPGGGVADDSRIGSVVSSPTTSSSPSPSLSPSRRSALASTLLANTHTMASHVLLRRPRRHDAPPSSTGSAEEEEVLIQTTNPLLPLHPHPSTILSSSHFERAVLTMEGKAAQAGLFEWRRAPQQWGWHAKGGWSLGSGRWDLESGDLQGKARVWVCGSWSPGIPLLEGCVVSSGLVVRELVRGEEEEGEARRGRESVVREKR